MPVDANIRSLADVATTTVAFEAVVRSLAGASVKIIALDACRDNPFAARLQSASGAINRGLAEVELDGHVVIYAAAAGQVALDGDVNSPLAQALARWVREQRGSAPRPWSDTGSPTTSTMCARCATALAFPRARSSAGLKA